MEVLRYTWHLQAKLGPTPDRKEYPMPDQPPNFLKPGDALGPYRVDSLLGKGGMGEVYRGTDTRLGRSVAIKISARGFSDRFEREAHAISSLNHPNVCTLYDVGSNYLVMEFVEGDTLAHLVKNGPMTLETVLPYAIQIADALSAAHAKGIIHRDLKPANIILTRTGVKVLDFGLAKLSSVAFAASGSSEMVTRTEPLTESGSILGTLQYMSPEQAEGKKTDERSDIFSFGAVLYEMLTGRRAFDGDSKTAALAAILKDQPAPIQQFQPAVPRALDRVVRKCLEKKSDDRWQSARDLKMALELIDLDAPASVISASGAQPPRSVSTGKRGLGMRSRNRLGWPVAAFAVALAAVLVTTRLHTPGDAPETRLEITTAATPDPVSFALSADGRRLAFVASADGQARLWVRSLDTVTAKPLAGTEGAAYPFWSPDGRSIGFFADSQLKRVDLEGGLPESLADASAPIGGAWNADGSILFAPALGTPLFEVPAGGGKVTPVTKLDPPRQISHRLPQFLPGGKQFLFFVQGTPESQGMYLGSLGETEVKRLTAADSAGAYLPPGWLLLVRQGGACRTTT